MGLFGVSKATSSKEHTFSPVDQSKGGVFGGLTRTVHSLQKRFGKATETVLKEHPRKIITPPPPRVPEPVILGSRPIIAEEIHPMDIPGSPEQRLALYQEFGFLPAHIPLLIPDHDGSLELYTVGSLIASAKPSHGTPFKQKLLQHIIGPVVPLVAMDPSSERALRLKHDLGCTGIDFLTLYKRHEEFRSSYVDSHHPGNHLTSYDHLALSYKEHQAYALGNEKEFSSLYNVLSSYAIHPDDKIVELARLREELADDYEFQRLWRTYTENKGYLEYGSRHVDLDPYRHSAPSGEICEVSNDASHTTKRTIERNNHQSIRRVVTHAASSIALLLGMTTSQPTVVIPASHTAADSITLKQAPSTVEPAVQSTHMKAKENMKTLFGSNSSIQNWIFAAAEGVEAKENALMKQAHSVLSILKSHGGISLKRLQTLALDASAHKQSFDQFLRGLITLPQVQGNGFSQNYLHHLQYLHGYSHTQALASPQWMQALYTNFRTEGRGYVNHLMHDDITMQEQAYLAPQGLISTTK